MLDLSQAEAPALETFPSPHGRVATALAWAPSSAVLGSAGADAALRARPARRRCILGTRFLVRHCILGKFREIAPVF